MRTRRIYDGNDVIFDYKNLFGEKDGKVLVEMRNGPISYMTEEGVRFWARHPYQWVSEAEATILLNSRNPEFQLSNMNDLEDYYSYD